VFVFSLLQQVFARFTSLVVDSSKVFSRGVSAPFDFAAAGKKAFPYKAPKSTLYPEHTNPSMVPAKDRPAHY